MTGKCSTIFGSACFRLGLGLGGGEMAPGIRNRLRHSQTWVPWLKSMAVKDLDSGAKWPGCASWLHSF